MASSLTSTEVYLEHYRLTTRTGGTPVEIGRNGPAITYRASEQKTGAPVALTIVPVDSVDPAEIDHFEEQGRAAMLLDHINIAKTIAFGRTDDSFVFVSEYPPGETVEAWVKANGPMPPDAVVRIALQVVTALGAASFHELTHPAIQPGNLVIVRGKTAEDGWPFVKLTHFALAGLKSAPGSPEPDLSASEFASPEQLLQDRVDFRSEIYSLGATMCFLLTGVFYSAYPRSPQTKRFARPLRTLIAKTLEDDPALRPQNPVSFTEELRNCLAAIDRRIGLQRRFGIPFSAVARPPRRPRFRKRKLTPLVAPIAAAIAEPEPEPDAVDVLPVPAPIPRRRFRYGWAIAAALFIAGLCAALLLPEDVVTSVLHRNKEPKTIGVPVGVPESTPATAIVQNSPVLSAPAPAKSSPQTDVAPVVAGPSPQAIANAPKQAVAQPQSVAESKQESTPAASQHARGSADEAFVASNAPATSNPAPPDSSGQSSETEPHVAPVPQQDNAAANQPDASPQTVIAKNSTGEAAPPAEAPDENVSRRSETPTQDENEGQSRSDSVVESKPDNNSDADTSSQAVKPRIKKPATTTHRSTSSRVPRALPADPPNRRAGGTIRARVVGITPAGNVILQLPNGERAIVSPQDADSYSRPDAAPRRPRRVIIERRIYPPPDYAVPYQPFDSPRD